MCDVMWSRLTVVVRQAFHWQVKFRLLVLLRPTCFSQMCSWGGEVSFSEGRGRE